jgi:hypothetical protein
MEKKISEVLSSPEKWTKGWEARDANRSCVPADSESAVCWCLRGAEVKLGISGRLVVTALDLALSAHKDVAGRYGIELLTGPFLEGREIWRVATWQDKPGRTFAEVQALLKELDL